MALVNFSFDKERDMQNIWKAVNLKTSLADFSMGIKPELVRLAKDKELNKCKEDIAEYNKTIYSSGLVENFPKILDVSWNKIEKEYIKRLEKITGRIFRKTKINGYLTTIQKCPYSATNRWFMACLFNNIPGCMLTAGHELFHIHLHDYFFNLLELEVGEENAHDIKEAITTVLLNLEFKDLWLFEDKGYDQHKDLRNFISEEWKKDKDFLLLLEKCTKKLKNIND